FRLARDPTLAAVKRLGARTTPEVFVFDARLKQVYRGRIDDGWSARLRRSLQVRSHDLQDALEAVLAGKAVKVAETKAPGCPIVKEPRTPVKEARVSYHRDVAPILQKHCQVCHRRGEGGPVSLQRYEQARERAADIKPYTRSRQMPPWMPAAGGPFKNERRLSEREIETLTAWADAGAPEGDAKEAPPAVKFPGGWRMGPPDLV